MSKGQSPVIQYVLFFVIGISVFFGIGSFFKYQSDIFRTDIIENGLKMTNNQLAGVVIAGFNTCKLCDYAEMTFKPQNSTAGYQYRIIANSSGFYSISSLKPFYHAFSSYNLNYSLSFSGSNISTRPLTLTLNKNQNTLGVK